MRSGSARGFWAPGRASAASSDLIWYPARDGDPDRSGAPFPLLLSSSKVAGIFGAHLASHGFVVAGITNIDTYDPCDRNLIDQPRDILFVLDRLAAAPASHR